MDNVPNVDKRFSCRWVKIEEAIQDTLGQSANMERLSKCMEDKDWGETTLQQALQNISNFHEINLDSKKMVYKNEIGEIKDFETNKNAMKIISAVKLIKSLPSRFDELKNELESDMSNAFFDPEIKYEDVIKTTENKVKERGQIMLYSETKITKKQSKKPPAKETEKANIQVAATQINGQPQPVKIDPGKIKILNYIKSNNTYQGPFHRSRNIATIIKEAKICKFCLTSKCRQNQLEENKRPNCKAIPRNTRYPELKKF